jgi:hypothetical protein
MATFALAGSDATDLPRDLFGGIVTKPTKLDKWSRGTIKSIGDNELVSAEGGFEPNALVGRVINPNFERPLGVVDEDMQKKYGDEPQYCVKYFKIVANTADTIRTDPADGKLSDFGQAGDRYLLCGFFTVKKVNDRYVIFTPLGHPFFGAGVDACYLFYLQGNKELYEYKYQSSRAKWWTATANRMKSVGFNMSAGYCSDVPLFSPSKKDVFLKPELPYIAWIHPLEVGMKMKGWKGGLFDSPIKDVFDGCQYGRDQIHGRNCGDVFDPQFVESARVQAEWAAGRMKNNPWFMGYLLEESDFLFAFARARDQFHLGWGVLAALPHQEKSNRGEFGKDDKGNLIAFTDTKVYTKYALRDFLKARYETIEKLNAAWGSNYTSWDATPQGYGKGAGLLDEDGKLGQAWLGAKHTMKGGNPTAYADLSDFLYLYVDKLHEIETAALRKADPNHWLIASKVPSDLKEYHALAKHVDMLRGLPPKGAAPEDVRPGMVALYLAAEEDSSMHVHYDGPKKPYRSPGSSLMTQQAKGQAYRDKLFGAFDYTPDGKTFPTVLLSYWSWPEDNNEKRNWGVVSLKDNLYDGKEATKLGADGKAGTPDDEDRDYGDCITGIRQANRDILKQLGEFITKGRAAQSSEAKQGDYAVPEDQY